jgi:hypothetical protein
MAVESNSLVSIRNSVIASLIVAWLLWLVPSVRGGLSLAWNYLRDAAYSLWDWLLTAHAASGWLLLLLAGLAVAGAVLIYARIVQLIGRKKEPDFTAYVGDHIHGAIWRWQWVGDRVGEVHGFCPTCDAQLVYAEQGGYLDPQNDTATVFICERCDRKAVARVGGGGLKYALGAVRREIERRVRTGEYRSRGSGVSI